MPDSNDVPIEVKISILQQKIALWKNTHYSASLDAQIAQTLGDDAMLEQAKGGMKRALQAQDELEKILAEIEADALSADLQALSATTPVSK